MKQHLSALIYSGLWSALDWVFPPECAACGEPGDRLCLSCQNKIAFLNDWGKGLKGSGRLSATKKIRVHHLLPAACSDSRHFGVYEGVLRECVHSIKYDENRGLAELFSRWLAQLVKEAGWAVDLMIPIPLSQQRFRERGYNQAALIAKPLAARLGIPYHPYGLRRVLDTPSQVGLSAEERRRNVANAFIAEEEIVVSKSILLVDDVMTTGSTLAACERALLNAGANAVYAVTVGRHLDHSQTLAQECHTV